MVEAPGAPADGGVAVATIAEAPHVPIVLTVTIAAGVGSLPVGTPGLVAGAAGDDVVCPGEREIGGTVVEGIDVEEDDARVAPSMIAMAVAAFQGACGTVTAVETGAGLEIGIDRSMAGAATLVLPPLLETHVTSTAVVLQFGVRTHQLAGHGQALGRGSGHRDLGAPQRQG